MMVDPAIRIPNLPNGQIVDENGNATDDELTFRHALITSLQKNFGNEGLVMPVLSDDPVGTPNAQTALQKLATIQNNQNEQLQYTCALGTMIYVETDPNDYTQDTVRIAVRNTNDYPLSAPLFKTVTLT